MSWGLSHYNTDFIECGNCYLRGDIAPNHFYGQKARLHTIDLVTLEHLTGFDV